MEIGVISEGHADRAVIANLISGILNVDCSLVRALRPVDKYDETDKFILDSSNFSTWSVIKKECEERQLIDAFLAIEGNDFIVIHIDSAEADEYGVKRPHRREDKYCEKLRQLIIEQINDWISIDLSASLLYAIAIEEIDAWILTIYDDSDSASSVKPKEKLSRILGIKNEDSTSNFDNFKRLSKEFRNRRKIEKGRFLNRNCSLRLFVEELENKVIPKMQ